MTVTATENGSSETRGGLAGLGAISGNVSHTTVTPTERAYISDNLTVTTGGDLTVSATGTNTANATATGIMVAVYGIGVSDAQATVVPVGSPLDLALARETGTVPPAVAGYHVYPATTRA